MKFFIFFALFFPLFAHCQNGNVSGIIVDNESFEGLPGVAIKSGEVSTRTDLNGKFSLSLPAGENMVSIRQQGYEKLDTTIVVLPGKELTINIRLIPERNALETLVISAGRYEQKIEDISVSMSLVSGALVENKATLNCETIIDQVPGVTVQDGQVSIRGGSGYAYGAGSRVLLMVDGIPFLSGDAGDAKWNVIPVENIDQIEIIKGASSVLYGSSALNGVINIRTGQPGSKPKTKFTLQNGVFGDPSRSELVWWDQNPTFTGASFFHSRTIRKNFDLTIGGNWLTSDGYRQGENEDRTRLTFNTRYRSQKIKGLSFGLNGTFQFAKTGLFVLWDSDSTAYIPSGGADPNSTTTTLTFQDGLRFNFDPYAMFYDKRQNKHVLRTRWFRTNNVNSQGRGSLSDLVFGEYQFQKRLDSARLNLTTGVSGYMTIVSSDLYGAHDGKNLAVFSQLDKKLGDKWSVNAGVRLEYFKLDTAETSSSFTLGNTQLPFQPVFRTGATYKMFEHTILRGSWGQGYRFPSVAEKYASTNIAIVSIFPNPSLEPERGWSAEIGLKQGFKIGDWKGYLDLAGFWTEYSNMIEFAFNGQIPPGVVPNLSDPDSPNYLYKLIGFQATNAEDARINGLDLGVVGSGNIGRTQLTVFAGYTYMNPVSLNQDSAYLATFSDTSSNMLKYRFRHIAKGDIQLDYKRISFGLSARYTSFMENIDRTFVDLVVDFSGLPVSFGDVILPGLIDYRENNRTGAMVFDTRISYDLNDNSTLALIVNNILNEEYTARPGDIRPPRTFIMQFSLQF